MYARIALLLMFGLLVLAAENRLLQAQGNTCQQDFDPMRADLEKSGAALQAAGKRKANAKELCARITSYAAAESKVLGFFEKRGSECGVPATALDNLRQSRQKTVSMRTKICSAAANPQAAPPPPSAGLSGALGPGTGVVPESPTGGGIFDTLSGNVLQQ